MPLVTADDIDRAAAVLATAPEPVAPVRTPLLPAGGDPDRPLWLKPENLQPTGAFKLRGALNAIAALPDEVRARGLVTYSSGNHALALSYAARGFGVPVAVCVPHTAPRAKVDAARELGAEIVGVDVAEREAQASALAAQRGATLIPPFDHPDIIAGQGTVGREIAADTAPDVVLVPISGGGLISGIGVAVKARYPSAAVIGVEPELAADTRASLRAGERVSWPVRERTRTGADGLTAEPSELTFAHIRAVVDDVVTVGEAEIDATVRHLATHCRIVAERSGAVAVAAHRNRELPTGRTVAVISGGNIDPADLSALLAEP